MALVPKTREQAAALAEVVEESDLTAEQTSAFRRLYRLDQNKTVAELVTSGEIEAVTDEDIKEFLKRVRIYGITGRANLDHSRAFLKQVGSSVHIALLRNELPRILRGYYLQDLMGVLNEVIIPESGRCKCGGKCICDNSECKKEGERP
jgi:hypothetical protein